MHIIKNIIAGSIADEAGLVPGDAVVAINGEPVLDLLDYMYHTASDEFDIEVHKLNGDIEIITIINEDYEEFGAVFENSIMDKQRSCGNKCIFCFVDQMPKGMRPTLYFKDDDYRLSFLQGNYVTMTNFSERDIERIIALRIPRINVSVHATDLEVRRSMIGNRNAKDVLPIMRRFAEAEISMNAQIVLCRDINDGETLEKTVRDLAELYPALSSLSVVPVGLTKYREGLHSLKKFDKMVAKEVVNQVSWLQTEFLNKYDSRIVYLGDEFYLMAGDEIPPYEHYERFLQIENGVGMMAQFRREFEEEKKEIPSRVSPKTIVTGVAAGDFIKELVGNIVGVHVAVIKNEFFGEGITVSGLITGQDIVKQLCNQDLGSVLIPENMLRRGEDVFLDDMTVEELSNALGCAVIVVPNHGGEFLKRVVEE